MPADQLMQLRYARYALGQPPLRQHLARLIHHLDVVMVLRPVITHAQPHAHSRQRCPIPPAASGRTISNLIKQCSRQQAGTTSQQRSTLPGTGRGTIFPQGSKPRRPQCSPAGGHLRPSLPDGGPVNSY